MVVDYPVDQGLVQTWYTLIVIEAPGFWNRLRDISGNLIRESRHALTGLIGVQVFSNPTPARHATLVDLAFARASGSTPYSAATSSRDEYSGETAKCLTSSFTLRTMISEILQECLIVHLKVSHPRTTPREHRTRLRLGSRPAHSAVRRMSE